MKDVIEGMARAMIDTRTWPGAHIKANEVEWNCACYEARAAFRAALVGLRERALADVNNDAADVRTLNGWGVVVFDAALAELDGEAK